MRTPSGSVEAEAPLRGVHGHGQIAGRVRGHGDGHGRTILEIFGEPRGESHENMGGIKEESMMIV